MSREQGIGIGQVLGLARCSNDTKNKFTARATNSARKLTSTNHELILEEFYTMSTEERIAFLWNADRLSTIAGGVVDAISSSGLKLQVKIKEDNHAT